jgi:hypothetical protein
VITRSPSVCPSASPGRSHQAVRAASAGPERNSLEAGARFIRAGGQAHVGAPQSVKEGAHGGTMGSPMSDGDRFTLGSTDFTFHREG